jgi:hypothetical protein
MSVYNERLERVVEGTKGFRGKVGGVSKRSDWGSKRHTMEREARQREERYRNTTAKRTTAGLSAV